MVVHEKPHFIMPLLIPDPMALSNDIDVYLELLIDELMILWQDGVKTYDASTKSNFKMHIAVLWIINDFHTYANLSNWSTKRKLACPYCNKETYRLKHLKKESSLLEK